MKILQKKRAYTGKVINVDQVKLDFGAKGKATYELISWDVETGVSALPIIDDQLLLIKHFQLGINGIGWSLPTGGLHHGEDPQERMQVELQEEIGYKAGKLTLMTRIHTLPGYIGSKPGYIYLAEHLVRSKLPGDEQYPIEVVKLPLTKAISHIVSGEIKDSRTILAVLYYQTFIHNGTD